MRILDDPRCTLEPQVQAHAAEMFRVLGDPAIYEFENAPPPSEEWLRLRFARLERRESSDGTEKWLNWVIRLPSAELAGYVQATVLPSGVAYVAYELNSRHWRKGIGSTALRTMLAELQVNYGVRRFVAVLKARNYRSEGLLRHLGFTQDSSDTHSHDPDEVVMCRAASTAEPGGA